MMPSPSRNDGAGQASGLIDLKESSEELRSRTSRNICKRSDRAGDEFWATVLPT